MTILLSCSQKNAVANVQKFAGHKDFQRRLLHLSRSRHSQSCSRFIDAGGNWSICAIGCPAVTESLKLTNTSAIHPDSCELTSTLATASTVPLAFTKVEMLPRSTGAVRKALGELPWLYL